MGFDSVLSQPTRPCTCQIDRFKLQNLLLKCIYEPSFARPTLLVRSHVYRFRLLCCSTHNNIWKGRYLPRKLVTLRTIWPYHCAVIL